MVFSFITLISSSDTLTKREAVISKICPPAIITYAEVIIAEYDAILGHFILYFVPRWRFLITFDERMLRFPWEIDLHFCALVKSPPQRGFH